MPSAVTTELVPDTRRTSPPHLIAPEYKHLPTRPNAVLCLYRRHLAETRRGRPPRQTHRELAHGAPRPRDRRARETWFARHPR